LPPNRLYGDTPSWKNFRTAATARLSDDSSGFVGVTEIADFYPRIYQHRLVNALDAAIPPEMREYVRVLEKMLSRFAEGTSYGIPVGPMIVFARSHYGKAASDPTERNVPRCCGTRLSLSSALPLANDCPRLCGLVTHG